MCMYSETMWQHIYKNNLDPRSECDTQHFYLPPPLGPEDGEQVGMQTII